MKLKEEEFVKINLYTVEYLYSLPQGLINVIYEFLPFISKYNKIKINSELKRKIAKKAGKSFNTINQYVTKLVSFDILIRIDKGIYILNPLIFSMGHSNPKKNAKLIKDLELEMIYSSVSKKYLINHKYKNK